MNDSYNFIIPLIHLLFFSYLLYRRIKRGNSFFSLANIALLIWIISAVCSFVFLNSELRQYSNLQIFPAIFWCFLFYISIYPLLKNSTCKISNISANDKLIKFLCVCYCLITILPFIEVLIQFIPKVLSGGSSSLAESMADIHDDRQEGEVIEVIHLSFISVLCWKIINYSLLLPSFLFFYTLSKSKKIFPNSQMRRFIIFGFLLVFTTQVMYYFCNAQRSMIARLAVTIIGAFVTFYHIYNQDLKKKMMKIMIICSTVFILGLSYITFARFMVALDRATAAHDKTIWGWTSLYLGEGLLNYNEYAWNMRCPTEGDVTMLYYKKALGYNRIVDDYHRRSFWAVRTGIPQNIFYTHIGAFVEDFTPLGAFFVLGIFSIIMLRITRFRSNSTVSIEKIYILLFLFYIIANGYCYFSFGGLNKGGRILHELFIALFFHFYRKYSYRPNIANNNK